MSRKRDEILDHEADGIREFDNDLPRWWLYGFYFTILLGVAYFLNYHVLREPLVGPPSIQAEYAADVAAAEARRPAPSAPTPSPASTPAGGGDAAAAVAMVLASTDVAEITKGREIYESATHPCAACHRPDLGGLVGPNLTDDLWLHGCSASDVVNAVKVGFPLRGMLAYGGGPALTEQQVLQLASYILSKRGSHPAAPKAADAARDQPCPQ